MENQTDNILLKGRSSRACIGAGYRLFTGNFKRIFRRTWWVAVVYALFCGITTSVIVKDYSKLLLAMMSGQGATASQMAGTIAVPSLMGLCTFLISTVLYSMVFSQLFQHREQGVIPYPAKLFGDIDSKALLRVIVWSLVCSALMTVVSITCGGIATYGIIKHSWTLLGFGLLLGVIILILMVPLGYPAMRYLTTRDTKLATVLSKDYAIGLRHWGLLFTVLLLTIIISEAALLLTTLPAFILTLANVKAQTGLLMGDPLGMPDYISWLTWVVFTIAGFIQAYVILSIFFPAYYACGSIETQEQERNEAKNSLY